MFCDDCGDIVLAARPIIVAYLDNKRKRATKDLIELLQQYGYEVLEILICPDCWDKRYKNSRKRQVASMLRILKDE
jgi:methylmalonyl-CoA mutase cobalamin-binding subunit